MTFRDSDLIEAIQTFSYDERAYSYILQVQREVAGYVKVKPEVAESYAWYRRILDGLGPLDDSCQCCGRMGLLNVYYVGMHRVGSECRRHVRDESPCKAKIAVEVTTA